MIFITSGGHRRPRLHRETSLARFPLIGLLATPWISVAFRAVVFPLKRLEIGQIVRTSFCNRFNVVNFPTVLGICVAMVRKFHWFSALVIPPDRPIISFDRTPFFPNRANCRLWKRPSGRVSVSFASYIRHGFTSINVNQRIRGYAYLEAKLSQARRVCNYLLRRACLVKIEKCCMRLLSADSA